MKQRINNNKYKRQETGLIRGKEKPALKIPYQIYNEPMRFGIETKYRDTLISATTSVSNAGTITTFSNPQQGNSSIQRVADRCYIQDIELTAQWSVPNTGQADLLRWIIVQEIGASVSPPTATDILQAASPISPYLYNVRDLYHVLHDELIPLGANSDIQSVYRRFGVKARIPDLKFVAGTSNLYSGQIFMLQITYNNTNVYTTHYHRIWFCDKN